MIIPIQCNNCGKSRRLNSVKLSPYFNKTISLRCKHCGKPQLLKVDANLINQKTNSPLRDTVVLNDQKPNNTKIAKIHIIPNNSTKQQRLQLQVGENLLGRKSNSKIHENKREIDTQDKLMSRSHCIINVRERKTGYKYFIKDCKSINGVYVNNIKIMEEEEIALDNGDTIRLGKTQMKIV